MPRSRGVRLVRKPTGIWHVSYWHNEKRRFRSTGTRNRSLAEKVRSEIELRVFRGLPPEEPESNRPLREFVMRFIRFIESTYTGTNIRSERTRMLNWLRFFEDTGVEKLQDVQPGHVEEFFSTRLRNHAPKTRKNYLTILKTCFNKAVEWGVLDGNPVRSVKPPKVVRQFKYFTNAEVAKLLEVAEEPFRTGVLLLLYTGLRRAELYNLRWTDVDLERRQLTVMPRYREGEMVKGRRPRTVPLNERAVAVFENARALAGDNEYVFRHFKIDYLTELFFKLSRKAKVKGRLHDLRHTFASRLAMDGVPLPVIRDLLGHSDIKTTEIYAHLNPAYARRAVDDLSYE